MTQATALSILSTGANVFLTGEPGSGKTHTINAYIAERRTLGVEVAVTASTGIAATHLGGMTLHAWCGLGIREFLSDYDLDLISQKERVVKRVRGAKVLVIDEISMLGATTLDSVERICRTLRGRPEPFGGLQVIFVGDFFQLPPVTKRSRAEAPGLDSEVLRSAVFAFEAGSWRRTAPLVCYLEEQHRQADRQFLAILSDIRHGAAGPQTKKALELRVVPEAPQGDLPKLFPHNANVDVINTRALAALPGVPRQYVMQSRGAGALVESLKKNCLSPELLALKVGAKVLFTKNDPEGAYVNGTLGRVAEFAAWGGNPVVVLSTGRQIEVEPDEWSVMDGNKTLAAITQLPLRLAWAITVHKSQGMSLDEAVIDLSQAFEYGQGYVALSRVRTLGGLYLLGFNARALEVHPAVLERDKTFRDASNAAAHAFTTMPKRELESMQRNFTAACGATVPHRAKALRAKKR